MTSLRFAARLCAASLALAAGCAPAQDNPLPPEEVFRYTARADAERVYVDFDVLDDYYLYRTRFGFGSGTNGVALGAARFPRGETHSDEFFGEQEIYRRQFRVSIPYRRSAQVTSFDLKLELQGCAPTFCYLPQEWTATIALPPASLLELGGNIDTSATGDLLPVDEAFTMNARFDKANELTVAWQIAPGYYLYRDKLTVAATGRIDLGAPSMPAGAPHTDDNFGDVEIFRDYVELKVPFARASPDEIEVELTAGFQGCKEGSICYPPGEQLMALVLPPTSEFPASQAPAASAGDALVSEQDQWLAKIVNGSWWTLLGGFYVAGLLLSFTPCVLPMVPILSSIIAGQGATVSPQRGFLLSLSYVLGMAATYTAAGAVAALAGSQVQALFQEPWLITLFAGLFVVLALGMFGLFELQMPAAIQTRLTSLANRQKGGTFIGTAIVGALTALIVTTCVAPPLIGALTFISQTGDVARGSGALFALSIGMGTPLLLVGASAGQLLPRVGPWMNNVKAGFGVMLIGVAIWMMDRVLPGTVTLVLWSFLVFLTGVFLGAFEPLPASPTPVRRLAKGLGVLACLYGALLLIGATLGGDDPLRPIPQGAVRGSGGTGLMAAAADEDELEFRAIETVAELDAALAEARAAAQPVMLDFTAEWCISCKEMEEYTFPDPQVIGALKPYMLLRADVTDNNDDDRALLQRFRSFGPPTIAFFDRSGFERTNFKLVGFVPAEKFSEHARSLAAL
jgi:thiol:disulfide interchange protein DsbD